MIEMREFGADATEIVPDACENGLDLRRRFLRKCGGQIDARRSASIPPTLIARTDDVIE